VHVEPWVAKRLGTLRATTGQAVERRDGTDDRRALVLQRRQDDTRWAALASALHQHTGRVSALPTARVHVESPRARAYPTVTENGLLQCGHSTEYRPDLPHVKVMQAVLDPLGMPLATDVVSGARAAAPLSRPCIPRVQARVGRRGLWSVGDGTRASRATRACLAGQGDCSLCPLPQ
jgi:transposase